MNTRIKGSLLIAVLLQAIPTVAAAQSSAVLSAGSAFGSPGETRSVPITLSFTGVELIGLSFDLGFDPDRVSVGTVSLGPAASTKTLETPTQPSPGILRITISPFDEVQMSEGVVVNIQLNIRSGAPPGSFTLALTNTTLWDPSALSEPGGGGIPHTTRNGSFTVFALTNTPVPTLTPVPPTSTPSPSATASYTPRPSNTSPPAETNTPSPSPTASSTPSSALTPSATATATLTQRATTTHTLTSEGTGEGLDFEAAAAATGTALAEFERAVAATATALAEEVAARPTDQIVDTGPSSNLRELCMSLGLPLPAMVLGRGVAYLIWRRQRT